MISWWSFCCGGRRGAPSARGRYGRRGALSIFGDLRWHSYIVGFFLFWIQESSLTWLRAGLDQTWASAVDSAHAEAKCRQRGHRRSRPPSVGSQKNR